MSFVHAACLAQATGGAVFCGKFQDAPRTSGARVPVVVFMHGSSGLGLKVIGEWQQWLAGLGWARLAPDSFALNLPSARWATAGFLASLARP